MIDADSLAWLADHHPGVKLYTEHEIVCAREMAQELADLRAQLAAADAWRTACDARDRATERRQTAMGLCGPNADDEQFEADRAWRAADAAEYDARAAYDRARGTEGA